MTSRYETFFPRLTSIMMAQMCWMQSSMASEAPETVTARSVELGSISEATWIEAPVTSRISLIFDPPLPISDPHWDAGTISLNVMGGFGTLPLPMLGELSMSCE
jgi:hypothetical protein